MIQIIPSILATTKEQYQKDLLKLSNSPSLQNDWIHIDFADGVLVENKTIGIDEVFRFPANFIKEAHLMVEYPKEWVDKLIETNFKSIIFHIESKNNITELVEYIKSKGLQVGLAVNHETDIEKLEPFLGMIDIVLVMTIVAGFQGQPFIPKTLEKVKHLKSKNLSIKVGVDGGVSDENIKEIVASGVDFVIMGSYLLKGNIEENLEIIWELLYV